MIDDDLAVWDDEVGAGPEGGPRFCGRCDRDVDADKTLCESCGERVRGQGYCPICERFWRLQAGTPCPKHDVPLEQDRPGDEFPTEEGPIPRWVTVETFGDSMKAEAPRIRLEAEGIPTFVEGARMGSHSMYPVATGGVRLQVPEPLVADARVVLSQNWSPVKAEDDLDDAWDELAPEPGSVRRRVMKAAILLSLFGPLVVALAVRLFGL